MNFRLEYKEAGGCFHFDNFTHEENTHGWVTIHKCLPDEICTAFANVIDEMFVNNRKPTAKAVKQYFDCFYKGFEAAIQFNLSVQPCSTSGPFPG